MKTILRYLLLPLSFAFGQIAPAQLTINGCSHATSLGTLPAPAMCTVDTGISIGNTVFLAAQTTVGAIPSNPYPYMSNCPVDTTNPPGDVWYSFWASGTQATISVQPADFSNPMITVWSGSCGALQGIGCTTGFGHSASLTVYGLQLGQTYYIQVAGDTGQAGFFDLAVHNDISCSLCLLESRITATPPPVNGQYLPGQTVRFCFTVLYWNQIEDNWLHGMAPVFGPGWDTTTLVPGPPPPADAAGSWGWYPGGINSTASGTHWPAGFYFNSWLPNNYVGGPGNSLGDNSNTDTTWQFYLAITAGDTISPGTDLSVAFSTSADGQSGAWINHGCDNDTPVVFHALSGGCGTSRDTIIHILCNDDSFLFAGQYLSTSGIYTDTIVSNAACNTVIKMLQLTADPFAVDQVLTTDPACACDSNGQIEVIVSGGVQPYTYFSSLSPDDTNTSGTFSGYTAGNYCITAADQNGCSLVECVTLTQPLLMMLGIDSVQEATCTLDSNGGIFITPTGGTQPYRYTWSNAPQSYTTIGELLDIPAGEYCVTVTDLNSCSVTSCIQVGSENTGCPWPLGLTAAGAGALVIQPNPAHDQVSVSAEIPIQEITIKSMVGQEVLDEKGVNSISSVVDLRALDSGIYIVLVKTEHGSSAAKLVVER